MVMTDSVSYTKKKVSDRFRYVLTSRGRAVGLLSGDFILHGDFVKIVTSITPFSTLGYIDKRPKSF